MFMVLSLALAGNRTCVGISQVLKKGSGTSKIQLSSQGYIGYFLRQHPIPDYKAVRSISI